VSLLKSFWRSCPELRSAAIGRWLLRNHLAPWPRGLPPALVLRHVTGNRFEPRSEPRSRRPVMPHRERRVVRDPDNSGPGR
jgi:hypothetical protein